MSLDKDGRDKLTETVRELGLAIRDDARDRWKGVRTAHRRQRSHQVWRFRTPDAVERFLLVPEKTIGKGRDAAAVVMTQLRDAGWLDRLQVGPEKSFILAPSGQLRAWKD